jgi:hypothetical protein
MANTTRTTLRLAAATTAVVGLVGSGAVGALASPSRPAAGTTTPTITAKVSGGQLTLSSPRTFHAGRVLVSLTSGSSESSIEVIRLHKNYTWTDFKSDIKAFGQSYGPNGATEAGVRHLDRATTHTTQYGGYDAPANKTRRGYIVLPAAGDYIVFNDSGNLPAQPHHLKVTAPAGAQTLPKTAATITAKTDRRFGGATQLPTSGNLTFKNISTESPSTPHMLILQHVKQGTTRRQVIAYAQSNSQQPPSWALRAGTGTDLLGEGQSMTLHYSLPKGEYAVMCFMPDPQPANHGEDHAAMGMVRMIQIG